MFMYIVKKFTKEFKKAQNYKPNVPQLFDFAPY